MMRPTQRGIDRVLVRRFSAITATVVQGPSWLQTGNPNRPSPTLMYLPALRSLPYWTRTQNDDTTTTRVAYQDEYLQEIVDLMESNASKIRDEYIESASKLESDYDVSRGAEHDKKLHTGAWDWHSYMLKGVIQQDFSHNFSFTWSILQQLKDNGSLFDEVPFGFCFFSTLHPLSKIKAHVGPMNFRLRLHLPLVVPKDCGIRVAHQERQWHTNKALVLDDSFVHDVWNNDANQARVLLLVDVWHPDVSRDERQAIRNMFQHAQDQGWLGKKE